MFNERLEIKEKQRKRLKAGLQKIEEGLQCAKFKCGHFIHSSAAKLVDELKAKAREQQTLLQQKQQEADTALVDITSSMQRASMQKTEVEKVKSELSLCDFKWALVEQW